MAVPSFFSWMCGSFISYGQVQKWRGDGPKPGATDVHRAGGSFREQGLDTWGILSPELPENYPLVIQQNHTKSSKSPLFTGKLPVYKWWISIAMLDYQRIVRMIFELHLDWSQNSVITIRNRNPSKLQSWGTRCSWQTLTNQPRNQIMLKHGET